jgi:hypothetical protein
MDLRPPALPDVAPGSAVRTNHRYVRATTCNNTVQCALRVFAMHDQPQHEILPDHPSARIRLWDWSLWYLYRVFCLCWAVVCAAARTRSRHCDWWEQFRCVLPEV